MPTPLSQYQNTQVITSTPEKILIMLYDGAINFTKIAKDKLEKGDIAGKGMYISKAQAIVAELMNTLNHDVDSKLASNLERLYVYLIDEYIAANINNSTANLDNVLKIMSIMRETWVEAIEIAKKENEAGGMRQMRMLG